jgi:hypothetical protein
MFQPQSAILSEQQGIRHTEYKGTKRHKYQKNHSNTLKNNFNTRGWPIEAETYSVLENFISDVLKTPLSLNICYFVHQCNTFTSYFLLIVDMFRPHTAIFRCYSILSRSWCSVMPIFAYVMLPAMWFSWCCRRLIENKEWMCYIDGQNNKYSV